MHSVEPLVSAAWLADHADDPTVVVLDTMVEMTHLPNGEVALVSGYPRWQQRHIPNSVHIDVLGVLSDPDAALPFTIVHNDVLAEAFAAAGVSNDSHVVVYDREMNMWAARVWWLLRSLGCEAVSVLDGGLTAWERGGFATVSRGAARSKDGDFVARPRPIYVDSETVARSIAVGDSCIVNALDRPAHNGTDTRFGRAGHIPTSHNLPATELVDADSHQFLPLEELAVAVATTGVQQTERILVYCGGGTAAASLAFVLHRLGHHNLGIYDGSLREWIATGLELET